MANLIRKNVYFSFILTILRLYLGLQWIQAGWGKMTGNFDASGFLISAVKQSTGEHPSVQTWWADFLKCLVVPNIDLFNLLVPWGEFLVGIGLILGTFTTFSALMGFVMNFSYMFSGATSTNPQMVLIEIVIMIAGFNSGKIGLDRWIIPLIKKKVLLLKRQKTFDIDAA
ncbi:DoxX family protein [Scopulibacillus cellulosilyticus]|uniref:DoxX family protein n=1 Tax=Scopulibacillus cellulosilyticus TaxID=2665665 RepID=A0ABW2Q233_9BACL